MYDEIIWLQKIRCGFVWLCKMFGLESSFPQVSCTSICMWGEACVNVEMNGIIFLTLLTYNFLDLAYIHFFNDWSTRSQGSSLVPCQEIVPSIQTLVDLAPWRTASPASPASPSRSPWHLWGGLAPPEALAVVALFDYLVSQPGVNALCLARDGLHQCISNMVAFRVGPV